MEAALARLSTVVDDVAGVVLCGLDRSLLTTVVVELQVVIDRLTLIHAQVVTEADRAGVWAGTGARSMADWLAQRTNTSWRDAQDRVVLGDAADTCPELAAAVGAGELSAKSALELADAVRDGVGDTAELVDAVKGSNPRQARAASNKWRDTHRARPETAEEAEERRYQKRAVRAGLPDDGLVTSTVVLPELWHRQFMAALSSITGALTPGDDRSTAQRLADGLHLLCDAYAKGDVTGGRERASMIIVIDADTLTGDNQADATTGWHDRVPAHVARRLAENAVLQRVVRAGDQIINHGRSIRYATDTQFRALIARDGGCRWPGCDIPASWCEIDHLTPWETGGTTDLTNLVMWCTHHHHQKHRPGVTVIGDAHHLHLQLANGTLIHCPTRTRPTQAAA